MKLSKNFTLQEFTKSQTALRQGIDNTPEGQHLEAAKKLFENVVQKVRDNFGPTVINSGYRGPKLNEAVGGSKTSQWIVDNLEFDQVILEFYTPGIPDSGWVHVSYNSDGPQRRSILTAMKENGKTVYKQGIIA
jgi:zinc D-Ala-D-Ala carboxypeptidase